MIWMGKNDKRAEVPLQARPNLFISPFFCLVPCCFGDQVFSELTLLLNSKDAPVYNNSTENPPSSVV
jgi:hypothetical protein